MEWIILVFFIRGAVLAFDYVNPPLNMSGTPPIGSQLSEYTSVKLQCSLDANPTPSFSIWSSDGMKIQNLGTGQDTINISLTRTHNRLDLYCRADGELADYPVLSAFGSYIIKFSPSTITITQSPPGQVSENTEVTFTCMTDEAEPTADVAWNIGAEMGKFGSFAEMEGMYNTQKRISEYILTVDKTYNNMAIECYDRGKPSVDYTTTLDVRFSATTIELTPSRTGLIVENVRVSLTCETDESNPTVNITWSRDGQSVISGISASYLTGQYNARKRISILTLTTHRSLNGMVYNCSVMGKEDLADQYMLQVKFSATSINLTPSVNGAINEDTPITLTCTTDESNPTAVILWTKDDVTANPDPSDIRTESGNYNAEITVSKLRLKADKTLHMVEYRCTVGGTSVRNDYTMNVLFLATTLSMSISPDGPVSEDTQVTLTCTTDEANPTAVVQWTKNGASISATSVTTASGQYQTRKTISTLKVRAQRALNGAVYRCSVKGTNLSEQHPINVRFPKSVNVVPSLSNPLTTGSSLTMTCQATGGNPDEVLSYNWIFNPRYEVNSDLTDNTDRQLEIDSVQYTHAGVYTCEADNGAGVGSDSETVLVNFSPQDVSSLKQKTVYTSVNSLVLLNCTIRAYPIILLTNVIISFNDEFIPSSDISMLQLPADESLIELTFDPVTESDFGIYEVTVNNGIGTPTVITMRIEKQTNTTPGGPKEQTNVALIAGLTVVGVILVVVAVAIFVVCYIRRKSNKTETKKRPDNQAAEVSTHNPKTKTKNSKKPPSKSFIERSISNRKPKSKKSKKQPKTSTNDSQQEDYEDINTSQNDYVPEPSRDNQPEHKHYENVALSGHTGTSNQRLNENNIGNVIDFTAESTYLEGNYFLLHQGSVKFQGNDEKVMMKTARDSHNHSQKKYLTNQIDCLRKVGQHHSIVETVQTGMIAKTSDIGLAMKYYQNQDLTIFLPHIVNYPGWQTSPERQSAFKDFTKQILEGLTFLENQKAEVLHYQLSAQHVLIDDDYKCKLTGFGFKKDVLEREMTEESDGLYGAIQWKAPETIQDCKAHTKLSDTWAFGVLMYEIYNLGQPPYSDKTEDEIKTFVKIGRKLSKPEECPSEMYTLMKSCWEIAPEKRPTFSQLLKKVPKDTKVKPQVAVKPQPSTGGYIIPQRGIVASRAPYVNVKRN